jgi:CheY-like chemotaxis protein
MASKGGVGPRKVAVVDDEVDLASLFSILLKRIGYRTEYICHDGTEVVQAVSEGRIDPDVVLMDYRMPEMNGLDAAKKLRDLKPELKIIIATADDSVRQLTLAAGLLFIQKPFSGHLLTKTLDEAFGT